MVMIIQIQGTALAVGQMQRLGALCKPVLGIKPELKI
jgi:hypothetical protein